MTPNYSIPAGSRIGHVHLKVTDLQRALNFYCGLLGFELINTYGSDAAFISAGGYHHHVHPTAGPALTACGVGIVGGCD